MTDRIVDNPNWQSFASGLEADRALPTGLLRAIALNETNGGSPKFINATSTANAKGMFQFVDGTAKQYNVNIADAADSTRGASDYLADLMKMYKDPHMAAAAYNWGQGNLNKAISKAKQLNIPIDAFSMADKGLLPTETANYVRKLPASFDQSSPKAFSPEVVQQARAQVLNMTNNGLEARTIVDSLSRGAVASMIKDMRASGVSDTDIAAQIGGAKVQAITSARATVDNQSFLKNTMDGAVNSVKDTASGVKQLAARAGMGDLAALQQEQAATEADPTRQAVGNTAGGMIGSVLPTALALAIPGVGEAGIGSTVLGTATRSAALGAGLGATTPTTGDGQIMPNIVGGAVTGGAVGAGAHALSNALGGIGNKLASTTTADAKQANLAKLINEKIGQDATVINSEVSNAAHNDIGALFNKAAQGESVTIPTGFGSRVSTLANDLDTSPKVLKKLTGLADGAVVPAQDLLSVRSTLVSKLRSQTIDGADKQVLGEIVNHIDNHLASSLPAAKQEILATARDQYRHLLTVDNMIAKTNDSGILTPAAFNNAIKQGSNKTAFVRGNAPFQDLQEMANGLKHEPGPLNNFTESLSTMLAVHSPVLSTLKNALQTLGGGNIGVGVGKTLAGLGKAINPAQAAALAVALGQNAPGVEANAIPSLSSLALARALSTK